MQTLFRLLLLPLLAALVLGLTPAGAARSVALDEATIADLNAAVDIVAKARPSYRYIHSSAYINDLANGATCVAMGYAGDLVQAELYTRGQPAEEVERQQCNMHATGHPHD